MVATGNPLATVFACPMPMPELPANERARAHATGAGLAALPVQTAVAKIGHLYTQSLPSKFRSRRGIFYTPPLLVSRLLDLATSTGIDWKTAHVISPSCGGGAFLIEDADRMSNAMDKADPDRVVASVGSRLRGWDSDPFACWLSQVAVEAVLLPQVIASGTRLPKICECRDSLLDDWTAHSGRYDLVNDNPAFGKVTKSAALAERFSRSQHGHLNLYAMFVDLAVHLAKPGGGVIAYLTPTSYLAGGYFAKLRGLLCASARPVAIDLVASRHDVFPEVLQEIALSCFMRDSLNKTARCKNVHIEPDRLRIEDGGELVLPGSPRAPWIIARNPQSIPIVSAMRSMTTRLSDWGYRIKTGPLVPHKNRGRLHAQPGESCVPVIWAESIPTTGGRFAVRCQRSGRMAWYRPTGEADPNVSCQPALLLQRTTAKEQSRRLIGAVLSEAHILAAGGRVAVENHLNMVVPTTGTPIISFDQLARFFASDAADRAFRCLSGSVAVSASELEALPVPSASELSFALANVDPEDLLLRLYGTRA